MLSCFGLDDDVCEYEDGKDIDEYMDAMGLSPVTKAAYHDARGDFLRIADEKELLAALPHLPYSFSVCSTTSGRISQMQRY